MPFEVSIRRFFRFFTVVVLILTAISIVAHLTEMHVLHGKFKRFINMLDCDAEQSIPAWYSSAMLALSSLLCVLIAHTRKSAGQRAYLLHWVLLAAGFLWLSADEASAMHEVVSDQVRKVLDTGEGLLRFAWVVPAMIGVGTVVLFYLKFLGHLNGRRRRQFVVAGLMYVFGALVMEMIGGKISGAHGRNNLDYLVAAHVEEFCEMFAIVLFNGSLMEHLAELTDGAGVTVRFLADQVGDNIATAAGATQAPGAPSST